MKSNIKLLFLLLILATLLFLMLTSCNNKTDDKFSRIKLKEKARIYGRSVFIIEVDSQEFILSTDGGIAKIDKK